MGIYDKGGSVLIHSEKEYQDLWDKVLSLGKEIVHCPGGSASNTIKACAAFGATCGLIGKIGVDEIGDKFSTALSDRGVKDFTSKSYQSKTGQVLCFITEDGQRTMRAYLGASLEMCSDDLIEEDFNSTHLHIEGYAMYNEKLLESTLRMAKKHKLKVSYDIGSYQIAESCSEKLKQILKEHVSIVFCNETEACTLFPQSRDNLANACRLLGEFVDIAIVTCGKSGCYVKSSDKDIFHVPTIPVENPVDTTGAGDIFAAGFLYGITQGFSLQASARMGSLAGHHIVKVFGAELSKHDVYSIMNEVNDPQLVLRNTTMFEESSETFSSTNSLFHQMNKHNKGISKSQFKIKSRLSPLSPSDSPPNTRLLSSSKPLPIRG